MGQSIAGSRGACHACWRDAKANVGPGGLDHVVHLSHHAVHVGATPVAQGHVNVGVEPFLVVAGTAVAGDAVGVEVVVVEDTVDIIFRDDFLAHVHNALHRLVARRVKNHIVAGAQQQSRLAQGHVHGVAGSVPLVDAVAAVAVGVDPGVALHASLVTCLDGIGERVPGGHLAASAGEVARPGLVARLIHRVAHRAHLEVDGVEIVVLERVEHAVELRLLLRLGISAIGLCLGPVEAPHRCHPCRAELPFGHSVVV